MTKDDAQRRADQIGAFRAELEQLAAEGLRPFDEARLAAVTAHHERLLATLARDFDVDRGAAGKRMSLGMRIASLLGAAALVAAIVSFVYRVWGALPEGGQVGLLTVAPIAATVVTILAGRIEKTRYVASLFALVACAAFVLQTLMLAALYNLRGSPHVLAAWAAFGLAVAMPWRFGVPFAFGLVTAVLYPAALGFWAAGVPWSYAAQRPEPAALVALAALAVLPRLPHELVRWGRPALLILVLGAILVLSADGAASLLPVSESAIRGLYQVVAVLAAMATLAYGLRRGGTDVVVIGSTFAGLFLLLRFVDWWWDWMPRFLFFLILAAVSMAWLWGLRVARRRLEVS